MKTNEAQLTVALLEVAKTHMTLNNPWPNPTLFPIFQPFLLESRWLNDATNMHLLPQPSVSVFPAVAFMAHIL
jgi:hypothetical protein